MSNSLIKNILCISILNVAGVSTIQAAPVFSAFSSTEEKPLFFEDATEKKPIIAPKPIINLQPIPEVIKQKNINFAPESKAKVKAESTIKVESKPESKIEIETPINPDVDAVRQQLAQMEQEAERVRQTKLEADKALLVNEEKIRKIKEDLELSLKAQEKEAKQQAKLDAQAKRNAEIQHQKELQIKAKQDYEAAQLAKKQAKAEAKAKKAAEWQAYLDNQKKIREEQLEARAKAEAERQAKIEAQRQAEIEAEQKSLLEAEEKAKLEAQKKAEQKAKIEAEQKAKIEAEQKAKIEAEQKSLLEAQKKVEQKAKIEAEAIAKLESDKQAKLKAAPNAKALFQQQENMFATQTQVESVEASKPVLQLTPVQTANKNSPINPVGITPLQKATSLFGSSVATGSPIRQQLLGYAASQDQVKAFNLRYAYASSRMAVMPAQISSINLNSIIRLTGDQLTMFKTLTEKRLVEEYMAYHPLHAEVLSNYIKRIMTFNGGQTDGITIEQAIMQELTFDLSTLRVPSTAIANAPDQYLYILARLNENDQTKFWNWVNAVRIGNKIDVPSWVKLVDVMYSH